MMEVTWNEMVLGLLLIGAIFAVANLVKAIFGPSSLDDDGPGNRFE